MFRSSADSTFTIALTLASILHTNKFPVFVAGNVWSNLFHNDTIHHCLDSHSLQLHLRANNNTAFIPYLFLRTNTNKAKMKIHFSILPNISPNTSPNTAPDTKLNPTAKSTPNMSNTSTSPNLALDTCANKYDNKAPDNYWCLHDMRMELCWCTYLSCAPKMQNQGEQFNYIYFIRVYI